MEKNAKICSVDGCGCGAVKNGYCNKHNLRFKRYGDPLVQKHKSPGTVTDEDRKRWKKINYERNKERYKARAAKWRENNEDRYRARNAEYFSRPEVLERARRNTKEWTARNKDKKREYDKDYVSKNTARVRSYKAKRRAKERNATPPWLTNDQLEAIRAVYVEAERLTIETGVPHQVDHIVPLSGKTVSGLHVPWNLRAIPAVENNRRPRVWTEDIAA